MSFESAGLNIPAPVGDNAQQGWCEWYSRVWLVLINKQ
jgi:hypothetical protein